MSIKAVNFFNNHLRSSTLSPPLPPEIRQEWWKVSTIRPREYQMSEKALSSKETSHQEICLCFYHTFAVLMKHPAVTQRLGSSWRQWGLCRKVNSRRSPVGAEQPMCQPCRPAAANAMAAIAPELSWRFIWIWMCDYCQMISPSCFRWQYQAGCHCSQS